MKKLLSNIFFLIAVQSFLVAQSISNQYDDFNRLTRVEYEDGTIIEYSYDKLGNRIGQTMTPGLYHLDIRVLLEGAYDAASELMKDDLRQNDLLPLTEPYTSLGFAHTGGGGGESINESVLDFAGENAIVDWVFVELRDQSIPESVIATRSALLQRDGDVVDTDGISPVKFSPANVGTANAYVAVKHRNNLGVMAGGTQTLNGGAIHLDFTSVATPTYGTDAQKLKNGKMMLWSGDTDAGGAIDEADRNHTWNEKNNPGYLNGDCNMNGVIDAADRSITWNNRNKSEQIPDE